MAIAMQLATVRLRARLARSDGQASVEYALVVLAAAAVALAAIAWAQRSGKVGELLDRVFDRAVNGAAA
jgi:Flp pilus assembly pilin Flp